MLQPPTESELGALLERELFERVPFSIAVIDRDLKVVRANSGFEEYFGDWRGMHCYQVYKGLSHPCESCRAAATFNDGRARVSDETGLDRHGRVCHYILHIAPICDERGEVRYILEMSRDITQTKRWQREYDILFDRVPCYITVIDRGFRIIRANEKFRRTFGDPIGFACYEKYKHRDTPCENCPAARTFEDGTEHRSEQVGITRDGEETFYVVNTAPLSRGTEGVEHVIEIATDVTHEKQLERQKLDAERLAAVGQTVAGLAHTVKNLLMGLEGGMYMVDTGIRKGDTKRITRGWDVLQRNFDKTTTMVREFLSFAKGRLPQLEPVDPREIVRNIIELYHDTAKQQGVELIFKEGPDVPKVPLDPKGIEACLTNLVSNGIDAAMMREEPGGRVELSIREMDGELIFEVADNGVGMDAEIKQKIFTTFFTTKGGEGTGLGLLTTRKIVQEHGGKIEVDSEKGKGSTFRIRFSRSRLQDIEKEIAERK